MPIKWVQCRICSSTMHIKGFPEPTHRVLKRTGVGTCKRCDGYSYRDRLVSGHLDMFYSFVKKCEPTT